MAGSFHRPSRGMLGALGALLLAHVAPRGFLRAKLAADASRAHELDEAEKRAAMRRVRGPAAEWINPARRKKRATMRQLGLSGRGWRNYRKAQRRAGGGDA